MELSRDGIYDVSFQAYKGCLESLSIGARGNGFEKVRMVVDHLDQLARKQGGWDKADREALSDISFALGFGEDPDIDALVEAMLAMEVKLAAIEALTEPDKPMRRAVKFILKDAMDFTKKLGEKSQFAKLPALNKGS